MNRTILLAASAFFAVLAITLIFLFMGDRDQRGANLRGQFHTGEIQALSDLPGDMRLIYFGYLNCPDVCLTSALTIGSALKNLEATEPEARAAITNIFVTVDPSDDVIDGVYNELAGYMDSRYGGQGFALRPRDKADAEKMAAAFDVRFVYVEDEFFPQGYAVNHSDMIFLTDKRGKVLAWYAGRTPGRIIAAEALKFYQSLN